MLRDIGALDTVRRRGVGSSFTGVNFHVGRVRHEGWDAVGMSVQWRFPGVSRVPMHRNSPQSRGVFWGKLCFILFGCLESMGGMMILFLNISDWKQWLGVFIALLAGWSSAFAGDWPNYRGPDYNGISRETDWGIDRGQEKLKVSWKAEVGFGSSSVVTSGGRLFTMGNQGEEVAGQRDSVYCLDEHTGDVIWSHSYPCPRLPKYYEGGTLSTPTVDGDKLYTLSKMGDLLCLDVASGKVIWEQQLHRSLDFKLPTWHFSSSPVVLGERLILNMGNAGAAFDKHSGKLIWQNGKEPCGYSTPVPATVDGNSCLVICGADSILGVGVDDGQMLWRYPFFNKHKANCGDAVVVGDEVFFSSAYGRGCAKIRISNNEITSVFDSAVMRNLQSSCVYWGGFLYGFDEAVVKCIRFEDGQEQWRSPRLGKGSLSFSADGRMFVMGADGELVIARANPGEFDIILREQVLPARTACRTAPVLSNGRLYFRNGKGHLICFDVRK